MARPGGKPGTMSRPVNRRASMASQMPQQSFGSNSMLSNVSVFQHSVSRMSSTNSAAAEQMLTPLSRSRTSKSMMGLLSKNSAFADFNDPRAQTLKGRLIAPYVDGDFAKTYEGLKMYGPIFKFADREIEEEYHVFMNSLMERTLIENGIFGLVTFVIRMLILLLGMYLYLDTIYPVYYWAIGLAEVLKLVAIGTCLVLIRANVSIAKDNLEITFYIGVSVSLVGFYASSIVIMANPTLRAAPPFDLFTLSSTAFVSAYYYFLLLGSAPAATIPSRTKSLVFFLVFAACGMTGVNIMFGNVIRLLENNKYASVIELLTYLNIWGWALTFFACRCISEFKARIDYLQHAIAKKHVAKLKKEMKAKKSKRKGGTTGVEEILKWLNKAIRIVRDVGVEINAVELQESLNLMNETILKLTNTDKLFALNVKNMADQESASSVVNAFTNSNLKNLLQAKAEMSRTSTPAAPVRRGTHKRFTIKSAAPFLMTPQEDNGDVPACVLGDEFKEKAGHQWEFNVLKYAEETKNILFEMGMALLAPISRMSLVEEDVAKRLFIEIQKRYFANPYHNAIHGATVAHTSMSLCRMLGIHKGLSYDYQSELTLIVSALGHDMGHPGRNNAFFVNCVHPISVLYNDISVLENLHCGLIFHLLSKPELNIFDTVSFEEFMILRYRIIELVLATDMKMHFESQTKFRVRRASPEFDFDKNVEDMWLMLKMCLKAADLSHGALQWTQHIEWSMRVTEEFYKQGDNEVLMGMPKSPLCDRDTHKGLAKSQKGFIGFVVHPLYIELDAAANGALQSTCMIRLAENTVRWEERASLEVVTPMPETVSVMQTHVPQIKELMRELLPSNKKKEKATVVLKIMKDRKGKGTQTDDWESDDDGIETAMKLTRGLSGALVRVADEDEGA